MYVYAYNILFKIYRVTFFSSITVECKSLGNYDFNLHKTAVHNQLAFSHLGFHHCCSQIPK